MAIVVVISDGNAHAIHLYVEAGAAGYIGKRAVTIVPIELQRARFSFVSRPVFMSRPFGAVHENNVLPTVIVVGEEGPAVAECSRQQLAAIGAASVPKMNS